MQALLCFFLFFFNDTATTEIYTLSLHDALPISLSHPYPVEILCIYLADRYLGKRHATTRLNSETAKGNQTSG